ncbi:c-type cytochrome [Emticicia sp. TH156]|uniref:c-type cytochrome n=1 Tax=Emticicia sp. TH156 TaxID=2067454 RepID=UPI000C75F197|nr:c-type cytochrome [Emticicia sp. TH156]PLK44775.1 cytochrome C [Emticicia sp. TH156]
MFYYILLQAAPQIVQKDLPLPLPLPEWLLVLLLVVSFLVHILFINLMVGGSVLALFYQILGLRKPDYDKLAYSVAETITVNKSLAIVMGIAPLLVINTLYTTYFYTANALTGLMWIMVIPLVTIALLLLYAHKFLWQRLQHNKLLHISFLATAVLIFLFIPLIFLTNVNLMMFPDKWSVVEGFFSALLLPNVFPRYLHFLNACMAASGLFLVWYWGRKTYDFESRYPTLSRFRVRKNLYTITFYGSLIQFIIGPIILITLPSQGLASNVLLVILSGAAVAIVAMVWLWKEINADETQFGRYFGRIAIAMSIVVIFMGSGRQLYRSNALNPHRKLVAAKTAAYEKLVKEATAEAGKAKVVSADAPKLPGQDIFNNNCIACHQVDEKLVGPAMKEAAGIYKGNKAGLVSWIKKPGKKREGPPMPPQTQLTDQQVQQVAEWILSLH